MKLSSWARRSLTSIWMILRIISNAITSLARNNYFSVHTSSVYLRTTSAALITVGNVPNTLIGRVYLLVYRLFRATFWYLLWKFIETFSIENISTYKIYWKKGLNKLEWIQTLIGENFRKIHCSYYNNDNVGFRMTR